MELNGEWIDIVISKNEYDVNWDKKIGEEEIGLAVEIDYRESRFNQESMTKKNSGKWRGINSLYLR